MSKICKPKRINFFEFPVCIFSPLFLRNNNVYIFRASDVGDTEGKSKSKIAICKICIWEVKCDGIWKQYIDYYGTKEVFDLAVAHNCLLTL
jgi:hypothetical protein